MRLLRYLWRCLHIRFLTLHTELGVISSRFCRCFKRHPLVMDILICYWIGIQLFDRLLYAILCTWYCRKEFSFYCEFNFYGFQWPWASTPVLHNFFFLTFEWIQLHYISVWIFGFTIDTSSCPLAFRKEY